MQTETLKITGMTCGGCTSSVTRALVAVDGVHDVQVSLPNSEALIGEVQTGKAQSGEAIVQYDEQFTSPDKLKLAVQAAGYGIVENEAAINNAEGKSGCC